MFGIGPMELVLILVVALLVLGPKRMPELARTLGRGLNEFRRASNDLRQSLALDDLQNDLRSGMSGVGSIQKPGDPPDRPAQAGDDLPPGKGDDAAATSEQKERAEQAAGAEPPHPGELPLDADPHAHHDEAGLDEGCEDDDGGNADDEAAATAHGQGAAKTADSALGNVPVGGAPGPTDDRRG
jgi:Tat protein translocase TatB subunit